MIIYIYIYNYLYIYIYIISCIYVLWISLTFGIKSDFMDFYGFSNPWDQFNPVGIDKSSKLPQDLRQIVDICPEMGPILLKKTLSTCLSKTELVQWF